MRTLLSALMAVTILICGCVYFPGCTTAKNPPVITSFSASPASIEAGGISTLSWTVTGARSVSLDNGIGNVAIKGTRAVTPSATTLYTLTATNSNGSNQANTQVIVASGTAGTSSGSSGSFIDPNGTIPEQNTATPVGSDTSTSPALQFGPVYATPYASTAYDFVTRASEASWLVNLGERLTFPGSKGDSQGYVLVLNNATLEDNKDYTKVLETHPEWVTSGKIIGSYTGMYDTYTVMPNDHFYAKVGFLKGATAGNVVFDVRIVRGAALPVSIARATKAYDGSLTTIDVPLSDYVGQKAYFILEVVANNEGAKQDWAVWVNPRITR